jgi:hypothetical protein
VWLASAPSEYDPDIGLNLQALSLVSFTSISFLDNGLAEFCENENSFHEGTISKMSTHERLNANRVMQNHIWLLINI